MGTLSENPDLYKRQLQKDLELILDNGELDVEELNEKICTCIKEAEITHCSKVKNGEAKISEDMFDKHNTTQTTLSFEK